MTATAARRQHEAPIAVRRRAGYHRPLVGRAAERLLDALNASTTLDQVQDAFVTRLDGLIDVPAHAIYFLDPASLAPLRVRTKGASDSFLTSYEDAGRAIDPVLERVALERRTVHSRGVLDDHSWRGHPFYPVVAKGGFDSTMQSPIVVEGELIGTLDFARRRSDGGFRGAEARLFDIVARRVSDAVARALRFEELARQSTLVERALDALGVAVVATSLDSTLLFTNRAATNLLGGPGRAPRALPAALAEAIAADSQRLVAGRRSTTSTVTLARAPLRSVQRPLGGGVPVGGVTVRSMLARECGAVISLLYDRPQPLWHRIPVLSNREQEIVELVARGLSTGQIAEVASITQNTVKQHLKRIFGKLGVHSRAELVAAASAIGRDQSSLN
jgi:DNA-binding CsgD family transcriptional regulator/PAS domain-containing protein